MPDNSPLNALTNVFVLMLENHSFDNIFAMSGIPNIRAATTACCNQWTPPGATQPNTYCVHTDAPPSMTTDPGHEFDDVLEQLCGKTAADCYTGGCYPTITNEGYASRYATTCSEFTGKPAPDHVGDIMGCFNTPAQLPVINALAREFAICDAWFSSIPGPTWPNRFFVHGASSAGWTESPKIGNEIEWLGIPELGFRYENGSIFQALDKARHQWRVYQDKANQFSDNASGPEYGGWISQAASLHGINLLDIRGFDHFADDINKLDAHGNPAYTAVPYTFIEPNFGKSFHAPQDKDKGKWFAGPTYKGGSSQHPEDDPSGGEGLIKAVYEAIRASPVWETSLLVIVYDEHGGFYDSAKPGEATPPGDKPPLLQPAHNARKFDFCRYGPRVPAVIVSPLIPACTVDPTVYDHSSIPATLERWLDMPHLTDRDAAANDLGHLLSRSTPRDDCPMTLPNPVRWVPPKNEADEPTTDNAMPPSGNTVGFLHVLLKAELELGGKTADQKAAILDRFAKLDTKDKARDYIVEIGRLMADTQVA